MCVRANHTLNHSYSPDSLPVFLFPFPSLSSLFLLSLSSLFFLSPSSMFYISSLPVYGASLGRLCVLCSVLVFCVKVQSQQHNWLAGWLAGWYWPCSPCELLRLSGCVPNGTLYQPAQSHCCSLLNSVPLRRTTTTTTRLGFYCLLKAKGVQALL